MTERVDIMLAYAFTQKYWDRLNKPVIVQPKLEGDRLRAITGGSRNTTLLSSGAKERVSVPHIRKTLLISPIQEVELDGETYVHGMKHSQIRSIVGRTKNIHPCYKVMQYHVYDLINNEVQIDRLERLVCIFEDIPPEIIKMVSYKLVETLNELQTAYEEYLAEGYEGIIIRDPYAKYVRRKTNNMLKLKPRLSEYFTIDDVIEEQDLSGIPKGTFGAFVCITHDQTEFFRVGSGPTKIQRDLLWKYREDLKGHEVKIRFQNYTTARSVPKMQSIDKEWLKITQKLLSSS